MFTNKAFFAVVVATILFSESTAVAQYGGCQTICNGAAVIWYGIAGYTFSTVTAGTGTRAAILACNSKQDACMMTCAGVAGGAAIVAAAWGAAPAAAIGVGAVAIKYAWDQGSSTNDSHMSC